VIEQPAAGATPDCIWIQERTSGTGGFATTFVFELPLGQFKPLLVLDNGCFEGTVWKQPDFSYRYWLTSGAGSPVPYLVGELRGGRIIFNRPSATAGPDQARLDSLVEIVRQSKPTITASDDILSASLRGFFDLVYAGQAPQAWSFLDRCHDAGLEGLLAGGDVSDLPRSREAFRSILLMKMRESPFYPEVLRFNGGSIDPPER